MLLTVEDLCGGGESAPFGELVECTERKCVCGAAEKEREGYGPLLGGLVGVAEESDGDVGRGLNVVSIGIGDIEMYEGVVDIGPME